MQKIALIAAILVLLIAAVALWMTFRGPAIPRQGESAIVLTPSGHRETTTWDRVIRAASRSSNEAYLDQSPGGGWMFRASNGEMGRVYNPDDARLQPGASTAPTPTDSPAPAP